MKAHFLAILCLILVAPPGAQAQGLGDGLAEPLNAAGRAALERGIDVLASALAGALQTSRDAARAKGTMPMPPHISAALLTWYPADLLQGVEYRIGIADDATVQSYSIRYGDAVAVTTIDTITFANAFDATNNVALWAHEMKHVEQFRAWGVLDFARRYVNDYHAVEREAYAAAKAFKSSYDAGAWRDVAAAHAERTFAFPDGPALLCATPQGSCVMGVPVAIAEQCYCPSDLGPVRGISQ